MKVTGKLKAFLSKNSMATPADLLKPEGVSELSFFRNDMTEYGYTYIGQATITVDVPDHKQLVENKVDALRAEAAKIRAQATAKCTEIEAQIQNLLAIEFSPTPATGDQIVTE